MMYINCDYNEGAHKKILSRLIETNMEQTIGYGCDEHCDNARKLIKKLCKNSDIDVHFLVGGTQTNETVISAALRPHQGVLAAVSGHINVHETGAIESLGHKVLVLDTDDGKISASQIDKYYNDHVSNDSYEHIVQPKMVYISQPTELGTLYSLSELEEISNVCRKNKLFLFVDGARLGYGLAASNNDITLGDLARLTDVFYIGGTKVGALFGEAVVISNDYIKEDFRYIMKQRGGMLAKGRLLGVQFETMFEEYDSADRCKSQKECVKDVECNSEGGCKIVEDVLGDDIIVKDEELEKTLYMYMSRNAIRHADRLRKVLMDKNVTFLVENTTNQIFPILKDSILKELDKKYVYEYQERIDDTHSAIRFCTSWATTDDIIDELCNDLKKLL